MKLIKISIIAFVLLFSFQLVKAQSISIGASFGYHYPHRRVIVANNYPAYGYYDHPRCYSRDVYYARPVYYGEPRYYVARNYYRSYYHRPYYPMHRHYDRW